MQKNFTLNACRFYARTAFPGVESTVSKSQRHQNDILKPNSITLSGSKLVGDKLRTSFEPASVMEFGFYCNVGVNSRNAYRYSIDGLLPRYIFTWSVQDFGM